MALYSNNRIANNVRGRDSEVSLPLPFGGINTVQSAKDIEDVQCADSLNKWINQRGRMSSYYGSDVSSTLTLTDYVKTVSSFTYNKNETTSYNIIAWESSTKLNVGYFVGNTYTSISSTLTKGDIHFEQYMSANGTIVLPQENINSATSLSIKDHHSHWTVDQMKGKIAVILTGAGAGQYREIKSNTSDTIYFYDELSIVPTSSDDYEIREAAYSLLMLTKEDGLKEWGGSSLVSHTGIVKGVAMKIFKNICFIAGGDDGNTVYVSKPFYATDFSDGFADRLEKTPSPITAFGVYKGNLVAFKSKMSLVMTPTYTEGVGFSFQQSSEDFTRGAINHNCVLEVDGELVVCDERGVYMYGYAPATDQVLGVQERISDNIQNTLSSYSLKNSGTYYGASLSYNQEDELIFLSVSSNGVNNDTVFAFDWNRRTQGFSWWKFDIECLFVRSINGDTYIYPQIESKVYKINRSKYATSGYLKTKAFNLGSNYLKLLRYIRFFCKNIVGTKVGLRVHLWTHNYDVTIRDVSVLLYEVPFSSGGVGDDPVGDVGVGLVDAVDFPILESLVRTVLVPDYSAYHVQLEWYSEDSENFELDSYSMAFEFLTFDHDTLDIQF